MSNLSIIRKSSIENLREEQAEKLLSMVMERVNATLENEMVKGHKSKAMVTIYEEELPICDRVYKAIKQAGWGIFVALGGEYDSIYNTKQDELEGLFDKLKDNRSVKAVFMTLS